MRDFWRSHPVGIGEFADRFTGSADLYATAGCRPTSSVNLITVPVGGPAAPPLAPALQVRPIRRFGVALMRMSGHGDAERLIP
jgi:hypothetical protein